MRTSYSKKIYLLLFIIFVFGLGCGLFYLNNIDTNSSSMIINNTKEVLNSNSFKISFIYNHLIILSVIYILSFFILGVPLSIIYSFYNGITIGFIFNILYNISGLRGLLYSIIYITIVKLLFIILIFLFLKVAINISIAMFKYSFLKKKDIIKTLIKYNKKALIIFIIIIINDILLYFFGDDMLKIFQFLL